MRLSALTGIRILAALAVYASHVGAPAGAPQFLTTFFASGYSGVTLFFVLSGFVLALNYVDGMKRPTAGGVYDYLVARFARVYPLYLLLLLYYVVNLSAAGGSITGWWWNATAMQAWHPELAVAYSFDPPSWSISVEFFLYACFPLLIPLAARLREPRPLLLAAATVVVAMTALTAWFAFGSGGALPWDDPDSAHRWLYRTPLTRLGDFTLGILAALFYLNVRELRVAVRLGAPLAVGSMLLILGLMCWPALFYTAWSWDLAYAIPATVFIFGLAVAPLGRLARSFSLPFMVLLGEASYAFYLVHVPVLGALGVSRWTTAFTPATVASEAMTLAVTVFLAIGLHVAVERPARVYVRRVLSRRRRSGAPPSHPTAEPVPP